jgi:hypothetical protein
MLSKSEIEKVRQDFGSVDLSALGRKELEQLKKMIERAKKPIGAQVQVWNWVVENPKMTAAECFERFRQQGRTDVKLSSIRAFHYHAVGTLRTLAQKTPEQALAILREIGQVSD